jgi:hypothetical protein
MTVSTGAYAADAIVMAEPEPVEYVRVCDVYGPGFFYIPGTETCLRIGGEMRFETRFNMYVPGMTSFSRFQLNVDVQSETEWGTLRGYAEGRFDYGYSATGPALNAAGTAFVPTPGYYTNTYLNQGYIELITGTGTLRLGKSDTPYARFLGYGGDAVLDGVYGFSNSNEISYTFAGSNGFSAIVALLQDGNINYMPDLEAGVNFKQGWGSIGAIVGYDESANTWGAKGVFRFTAPNSGFSGGLLVMYSSGAGRYAITDPGAAGTFAPWSVLGYVKGQFTPKAAAFAQAQWFSNTGGWVLTGGLDLKPIEGFRIRPEMVYQTTNNAWGGLIRFGRTF